MAQSRRSSSRRIFFTALSFGFLASLVGWQVYHAQAQVAAKRVLAVPDVITDNSNAAALTLPTERKAQQVIEAARQLIQEKEWGQVVRALQSLLDSREDGFVKVTREGPAGKKLDWVSIKAEANRLLGTMPLEGMQVYEVQYGPAAKNRLLDAKTSGDATVLAEVATRYLHTEAGAEAVALLGTRFLNRDEPLMAALYFDRLLRRQSEDRELAMGQMPDWTLYKIALAFYRAGNKDDADFVWKHLLKKIDRAGGITIGKQQFSVGVLKAELDRAGDVESRNVHDWVCYRGGVGRTEQAFGGPPFLESTWRVPTVCQARADVKSWTEDNIKQAVNWLDQRGLPHLPAFFPIAVNGKVIYRSYDGIFALDLRKEGKIAWASETDGGLRALLSDPNKKAYLEQWNQFYRQHGPLTAIFENSVIGTLSTDSTRVFVVDDLALPPHPYLLRNYAIGGQGQPNFGSLTDMVNRNSLKAYNLESGKLVWELGGRFDRDDPAKGLKASELAGSFFLGPPLPLGGKIYVLTERNQELRLACLEPKDSPDHPAAPAVVWTQTLALTKDKLLFDFNRRVHAAQLAYGNGVLVCPTNAGAVLGVDLLSHSLVWAHSYRDGNVGANEQNPANPFNRFGGMPQQQITLNSEWRISAPAVQEGRVVFTAPDASNIHCLDLRDGSSLWKVPRAAEDLYFAGVFHGKALIVGKSYVKALSLTNGNKVWEIANVGMPSGQGTASDNIYYLPLKAGSDKEPEVCAIDIASGKVIARTKSRKKEVPGNLVFYEGEVLSQGLDQVASYPQVQKKLALIDDRIKKNPNDPVGLIERGELRLDRGDLTGALADLRTALTNTPPVELVGKAREKLFETMTEMLQRDFNGAEKYIDEYRGLCKVEIPANANPNVRKQLEVEQQRRQANFLCLLAKGRETQGRLTDALKAYMDFSVLTDSQEMIAVIDEPSTKSPPAVWARGRIAAMLDKAAPGQREPLEQELVAKWDDLKANGNVPSLRGFAELFGPSVGVGRQARLKLAEQLIEQSTEANADALREAQLLLLQIANHKAADPHAAGQAVDDLAQLMLKKRMLSDAAYYYRLLGQDYAKVVIKDGKTGADLFNEILADKRFLPFLEDVRPAWNGKFTATESSGQSQMQPTFTLEPVGQLSPFFQTHRLALDLNTQQLRVVNQLTNQDVWKTPNLPSLQYLQQGHPNVRTTYSVQGSVVVVNLGHMVYGFDVVDQKKLWEYNLYAPGTNQTPNLGQVVRDRDGNLQLLYQDGWSLKLGQTGAVMPSYICLLTRNGLVALDPIKGTPLWIKSDINSTLMQIFGDEQYVYLAKVNADGTVTGASQAVRASDGASINVPDFRDAYQKRVGQVGRNLLVRDEDGKNVTLRIYDVLTGKDLWKKQFPIGSTVLKSDATDLGGIVDPDGNVVVIDIRTRQEVLRTTVRKEFLDKLQEVWLVADRDQFYLLLNKTADGNNNGVWMNVFHGMRCLNVNGTVYAFDRATGKTKWYNSIANQMLVLDQFKDMPIMIFTARSNEWLMQGGNRINQHVVKVKTVHKQTGKLLFDKQLNPNINNFHALVADPKAGVIELVSFNMKIRHVLEPADVKKPE